MSSLIEVLKQLGSQISQVIEQPIVNISGTTVAWNVYIQNANRISIAGGTHADLEIAKRIAIAEAFERALASSILKDPLSSQAFLMAKFPSSCGFACGFDSTATKNRAIKEGVERWAWSKWIDDRHAMELTDISSYEINSYTESIFEKFLRVRVYKKSDITLKVGTEMRSYSFVVLLLEDEKGVFPGCCSGQLGNDLITHAATEAYRNYRNWKLYQKNSLITTNSIVSKRNIYFADHKDAAYTQIKKAIDVTWPEPSIEILKEFQTGIPSVFLWRCLMKDFKAWHLGNEKRFVY